MAELKITPPKRTFTLVLSEDEAMHVWAALGKSSPNKREDYFEANLIHEYSKDIDIGYEVFLLLEDVFGQSK